MKLKAQEIYEMGEAINILSQEKTTMPTAFYIAKNTKLIKEEITSIDEAKQKLISEFGEKKEDGSLNIQENGMVKIEDSKLPMFSEEMEKLLKAEIDLPIKKIPLSSLTQINIPINSIEVLLPIIEDDEICDDSCDNVKSAEVIMDTNGNVLEMK